MATIDDVNALNIRPRTRIYIYIYDSTGTNQLLTINSTNLIRATVSLRSDLSRINPTLPESEIEIEAYFDTDISDQLANEGEELQVRYRWYPDTASYSTSRYFYTDERITWSNKILHIHAVDQVHLLDEEMPPIYIGQDWAWNYTSTSDKNVAQGIALAFRDFIRGTKDSNTNNLKYVSYDQIGNSGYYNYDGQFSIIPDGGALNILQPRITRREAVAKMMALCRFEFEPGQLGSLTTIWPSFVDAGRPYIRFTRNTNIYQIKKEDCGNFKESKEPRFSSITVRVNDVIWTGAGEFDILSDPGISGAITKQKGITLQYGGYSDHSVIGTTWDANGTFQWFYVPPYYNNPDGLRLRPPVEYSHLANRNENMRRNYYGKWLLDDNVDKNSWTPNPNIFTYVDLSGGKWTTPYDPDVPDSPSSIWNDWIYYGVIDSDTTAVDVSTEGSYYLLANERTITKTRGGSGDGLVLRDDIFLSGHAIMNTYNNTGIKNLLPDMALDHILDTSNVVGSFTWKGDPRLQPRDFFELVEPDENLADENGVDLQTESGEDIIVNQTRICTIENITLTHEGGGTICEITYREGYC